METIFTKYKHIGVAQFEKISRKQFELDFNGLDAEYENIKLPCRATSGSAGYDIFSPIDFDLAPWETINFPTGVRVWIDEGWFMMIVPRSSLGCKYRLQLDNTVGVIDSDYYGTGNEGHFFLQLTNDNPEKTLYIDKGEAVVQAIFLPYGLTLDDNTSKIRTGGFGSTSK